MICGNRFISDEPIKIIVEHSIKITNENPYILRFFVDALEQIEAKL